MVEVDQQWMIPATTMAVVAPVDFATLVTHQFAVVQKGLSPKHQNNGALGRIVKVVYVIYHWTASRVMGLLNIFLSKCRKPRILQWIRV